ncbi:hypothetical protein SAMN04515620_11689 [Collimonas sp. OK607]|nr:hypothetical protein SAMN04515620_11689 [Collimonas sp. OK607]
MEEMEDKTKDVLCTHTLLRKIHTSSNDICRHINNHLLDLAKNGNNRKYDKLLLISRFL